jgi:hypothetical protein
VVPSSTLTARRAILTNLVGRVGFEPTLWRFKGAASDLLGYLPVGMVGANGFEPLFQFVNELCPNN